MQDSGENYYQEKNIKSSFINRSKKPLFIINVLLFILTFFTTTLAGVGWLNIDPYQLDNFSKGFTYSFLLLTIITVHEFGHFFAAKYHKIDVTLPYYIPFPFLFLNPFGTMGAVIKMRSSNHTRKSLFDVGIAGPIAGWVVSIVIILIGFMNLPSIDYLYQIHPEYTNTGIPTTGLTFGYNIVFYVFEKIFSLNSKLFIPPMNEIYHYPFLCVGWFGLLITSLNMMPVGQLDGGHISYTMFGEKSKYIGYAVFYALVVFGVLGVLPLIDININIGSLNWLVWALLILFIIKIKHPPVCQDLDNPLGTPRLILGWFSYFIFLVSFCPIPINEGF
jgi:membrane-associated protease RseP (regulator of RpoE activity)